MISIEYQCLFLNLLLLTHREYYIMIANKCYISPKLEEKFGDSVYRVDSDTNGNPRYVIHFGAFGETYSEAKKVANSLGFKAYRARWFGGGFVGSTYNLENTIEQIIDVRNEVTV